MAVTKGNPALTLAADVFPITPTDGLDLAVTTRWVSVSVGGTLAVITANGNTVTVTVPAGIFPMAVTRVSATGTTATGIAGYA